MDKARVGRHKHLAEEVKKLGQHQHLCIIYENQEQQFEAVVPFIREGLERADRCVYLADERPVAEILRTLERGGVEARAAVRRGSLNVTAKPQYLVDGVFDADGMIHFFRESTLAAKKDGYRGFRIIGEMTWVLRYPPGFGKLLEYEAKLDDFFTGHDASAICLYNRNRFAPETLLEVIKTHPIVIFGGLVNKNPYYVPAAEYLSARSPEIQLQQMLDNLRGYEHAVEALSSSELRRKKAEQSADRIAAKLLRSQDDERRRIARQLHETTVQDLIGLKMNLSRLAHFCSSNDPALRAIAESTQLTEQSLQDLRTLSHLLHPPLIEEAGLLAALRWYVTGFAERSGIDVKMDVPSDLPRLPQNVEIAIFRVAQEALSNVHRHSGSKQAKLRVRIEKSGLMLEVEDKGRGIDSRKEANRIGVGIGGMRERAQQLGGRIDIQSGKDGTRLKAVFPLEEDKRWRESAS